MEKEEAVRLLLEEMERCQRAPELNGCEMKPEWQRTMDVCLVAVEAIREQEVRENPKHLTLDELRQIDGEPVWIERRVSDSSDDKEWALVYTGGGFCRTSVGNIAFFALYGISWLAYRSKPK